MRAASLREEAGVGATVGACAGALIAARIAATLSAVLVGMAAGAIVGAIAGLLLWLERAELPDAPIPGVVGAPAKSVKGFTTEAQRTQRTTENC